MEEAGVAPEFVQTKLEIQKLSASRQEEVVVQGEEPRLAEDEEGHSFVVEI